MKPMTKQRELTGESFNQLLAWLDEDRERAARRYEAIRHSLIRILTWGGCHEAQDLADEVINRVTRKVPEIAEGYVGDPEIYFYGVARRLLKEWRRQRAAARPATTPEPFTTALEDEEAEERELLAECLRRCLRGLGDAERRLILEYYSEVKQAKIDSRKRLAAEHGLGLNALRVKAHRIRASLHGCILRCLGREDGGEMD